MDCVALDASCYANEDSGDSLLLFLILRRLPPSPASFPLPTDHPLDVYLPTLSVAVVVLPITAVPVGSPCQLPRLPTVSCLVFLSNCLCLCICIFFPLFWTSPSGTASDDIYLYDPS
ncbi:hypothetical protein B0H19DRAFT_1189301 [Mycena capillaripes]|nr:hypothetical protein B0H19DRAFT_1189301 [Mycena capillaripes]